MKIQVDCRDAGEPRAFYLGTRRLDIMRVLERAAGDSVRRFRVKVADGRVFVLSHDTATGDWCLARVNGRTGAPAGVGAQARRPR